MSGANHINYSAEDFARYHSGRMPVEEMNALEKAALSDPFIADALEGYANTQTASEDMALLREKFANQSKRETPVVVLKPRNTTWMKAAAILVIVAFSGYFLFRKDGDNKDHMITAKTETIPATKELEKNNSATWYNDSNKSVANNNRSTIETIRVTNAYGSTAPASGTYKLEVPSTLAANDSVVLNKPSGNTNTYQYTVPSNQNPGYVSDGIKNPDDKKFRDTSIINGDILHERTLSGKVSGVDFKLKTDSLADGFAKSIRGDSMLLASKDEKYDATAMYNITPTRTNPPIVLKDEEKRESSKDLEEVVTTGYGTKRNQGKKAVQQAASVSKITKEQIAANPVAGWENFKQYIQNNKKSFVDDKGDTVRGKVILTFKVSKNGSPGKIKVEKHVSPACDLEATRLLINGPKWRYTNGPRISIDIDF